ncbi:MAG TPA: hypothetical protein GXX59_07845 [Syntrophomonadaceae bacterium]|nr:hypothetical protein [Syntrophomonadaceae bacterium]
MAVGKKRPKKIYMPGDLGDAATRRNYRKSGPVVIYKHMEAFNKMGETIALSDFLQLPDTRAKDVMLELSSISDQRLADEWKVQTSFVRKIRRILGIQKDHSGSVVATTDILSDQWPPTYRPRRRTVEVQETMKITEEDLETSKKGDSPDKGFSFSLEGVFPAVEIEKRLESLAVMTACSRSSKYSIKICLKEIMEPEENNSEQNI